MSPQPEPVRQYRHELLEDLFRRGAILREEAGQVRAMARETRETSRRRLDESSVSGAGSLSRSGSTGREERTNGD